ncbi:MAG: glycosyltransferase [Alphaproteobacteria bacterium]
MAEPRVGVVLVDYRKGDRVVANVRSLLHQYPATRLDIAVIDNSADAENAARLAPLHDLPGMRVVINAANIGYTAACNQGAALVGGDFLLLLNPDILWTQADALRRLVAFMGAHPGVGIAGPRQVNDDGTTPRTARRFPSPWAQLARRSALARAPGFARSIDAYEAADLDYGRTQTVDWLQSSCVLVRRDLWDAIGGLDRRFFLFMADCVLCWRAWERGRAVAHVAEAQVTADGIRASAGGLRAVFRNPAVRHHLRDAALYHLEYLGRPSPRRDAGASFAVAPLENAQRGTGEIAQEPSPSP